MFLTLLLTVSCSEDEKTPAEVPEPVVVTTELTVAGLAGQTATMEATDGTKNEVVFDAEGNAKIETQPAAEGGVADLYRLEGWRQKYTHRQTGRYSHCI